MTLTIELTPEQEAWLAAVAQQEGLEPAVLAQKLVTEKLPTVAMGEQDPTLALFDQWRQEDAQMTLEEIEQERQLWEQFENGINDTRKTSGMRQL